MRGYSRVEEGLDEYENDELDEYGDVEGDEYGYTEDEEAELGEEDPIPKKEVQEYLELRQKLKEAARKKLAKQSGLGSNARDNKRSKLENFGSFFGPSRPVIAERVIQESKSFLETRQEVPRLPSSQTDSRKAQVSGTSVPKNGMAERRPHNPVKTKVQKLKDTRDYSFLLSDDADVPRTADVAAKRSSSVPGPLKSKDAGRNGSGDRRGIAANSHSRGGQNQKASSTSSVRPESRRAGVPDHKKQYPVSSSHSRPLLPKREPPLPMKKPTGQLERKVPSAASKAAIPNTQRSHMVKQQPLGAARQHSEERMMMLHSSKGKQSLKPQPQPQPQMKAPKQIPPHYSREDTLSRSRPLQHKSQPKPNSNPNPNPNPKPKPKPKPNPARRLPDDEDAILEIRKMFGYNPSRYAGDDDDLSDMEADFRTIQMEEKRSARIAREEDERELMLIQEEEERENQRKLAKKRKMGQR